MSCHNGRHVTPSDLVMNSSLVGSSLNSALGLNVTAVDSNSSSTGGAQLTAFSLTTAPVDNDTVLLSGMLSCTALRCHVYLTLQGLWHAEVRCTVLPCLCSSARAVSCCAALRLTAHRYRYAE